MTTANLRDHLLSSLGSVPGTREFHLHVLVSAPRKNSSLYIFAKPLPRIYLQDVLVLCSEQANADAPRVLVTAIDASVYYIPSTSSVVLYIGKVDTTGQGSHPSPTVALVRSLITFYSIPSTRPIPAKQLWIHLFARAQGQYLFPNSSEFSGKRVLSDAKLCAWWKRLLSECVGEIKCKGSLVETLKAYYLLPGYSEFEASNTLGVAMVYPSNVDWIYGQPYTQTEIPLPCPRGGNGHNLGTYIPSFDDDPKSRFLDEIAYNTDGDIKSPAKKRPRRDPPVEASEEKKGKEEGPLGELGKVAGDEFWERMSFRQECVSGAVTGFFALGIKYVEEQGATSSAAVAAGPGTVSSQLIKRVMTLLLTGVEFSDGERSVRATERVESTVSLLCSGIGTETKYGKYIYGKIKSNEMGTEKRRQHAGTEQVTVLSVRRKKRI
ncbi:hypothetical protein M378DRAFT_72674 [Amanita muscaria Koide BX008]|uniref:histone acetyltransferase n=1 Tax=Amanita muscaria (strain Koide BX008) TaxID=946122 RepID=A0A0C2XEI6_AMAMK|nr:hypothetical protein M378DRAFT_72674 [Amanita muscaria Koide BX008]